MTLTTIARSFSFRTLVLLVALVAWAGCDSTGGNEEGETPSVSTTVFVANQGNFGDANGSVSTYDPQAGEVTSEAIGPDVLGSTVQGIFYEDGRLYVVANTAQRIDVFEEDGSWTRVAQSDVEFSNPRYVVPVGNDKAYVTDQVFGGTSTVAVLDVSSDEITSRSTIEVSGSPEGITLVGDRAYIALGAFGGSTNVGVIDTATDALADEIDIGCAARFVLADADDEVFAFCNTLDEDGQSDEGQVVVLDGATGDEVDRIELDGIVQSASGVTQAAMHAPEAGEMYVVVEGQTVVRLSTATNEVVGEIALDGDPVGALGYDAEAERLYLGRVPGYETSGTVTVHDRSGGEVGQFTASVAPTHILVHQDEE